MRGDDADVGGGSGSKDTHSTRVEEQGVAASVDPADVSAGLYGCVTCGENVTRYGRRCARCERNIEEDKLERESGR